MRGFVTPNHLRRFSAPFWSLPTKKPVLWTGAFVGTPGRMNASLLPAPLSRSKLLRERLVIEPSVRIRDANLPMQKPHIKWGQCIGTPGRIRTADFRVRSATLYPLSYGCVTMNLDYTIFFPFCNLLWVLARWQFEHTTSHFSISFIICSIRPVFVKKLTRPSFVWPSR